MSRVTSIVTCMTDAERPYLARALHSVQDQTLGSEILLCIEEGNDWVDEVLADAARGVRVLRQPLAPLGVVRNRAIAQVATELLAFIDGDDAWHPDKLRRQVSALDLGPLDVVATRHVLVREDDKSFFYGFARSVPMPSSWLGRTSVFAERPFEDVRVAEDVFLWRRIEAELRYRVLPDFLLRYRVRDASLSDATWSKKRKQSYKRRSELPGMRPVLLGASYLANVAFALYDRTGLAGRSEA